MRCIRAYVYVLFMPSPYQSIRLEKEMVVYDCGQIEHNLLTLFNESVFMCLIAILSKHAHRGAHRLCLYKCNAIQSR